MNIALVTRWIEDADLEDYQSVTCLYDIHINPHTTETPIYANGSVVLKLRWIQHEASITSAVKVYCRKASMQQLRRMLQVLSNLPIDLTDTILADRENISTEVTLHG